MLKVYIFSFYCTGNSSEASFIAPFSEISYSMWGKLSSCYTLLGSSDSRLTCELVRLFISFTSRALSPHFSPHTVLSPELNTDTRHMAPCMLSARKLQQTGKKEKTRRRKSASKRHCCCSFQRWSTAKSVAAK